MEGRVELVEEQIVLGRGRRGRCWIWELTSPTTKYRSKKYQKSPRGVCLPGRYQHPWPAEDRLRRLRERCTSFEMITFQASYIELARHYGQRRETWGWTHTLVPTQLCPHICRLQITLSLALGHRLITHHFLKRILLRLAPGTLAEDWGGCFVYPLAFK